MHELLPWYANGTLGPTERESFEMHLAQCAACRKELAWVRDVQSDLQESGPTALSDHPAPASLLAAYDPEEADARLDPEEAREIRRHLSLCLTCAEEVRWLCGRAVADDGGAREPSAPRRAVLLPWLAFAAASLLVAILLPLALLRRDEPAYTAYTAYTGWVPSEVVASTERVERPATIEVPAGARRVELLFDVDLGPGDFPARLRVERGTTEIATLAVEHPDQLLQGLFIVLSCHRPTCPDGDYLARLSKARGGPEVEFRFRLETGPARP